MKNDVLQMRLILNIGLVLLILTLTACVSRSNETNQPTTPVADITLPETNSSFTLGQEILITFNAADVKGIAQVELSVDGQPVMVDTVEPPVNSYVASHRWVPETTGSHIIQLRAFNVDNNPSHSVQVFVTVTEAVEAAEAAPTVALIQDTPTPTIVDTPTPFPSPTPTEVDTTGNEPTVTALVALNVRMGPSTNYPVIGRLALNESARITGRDGFSFWWQIEYFSDSGNRGWVAAGNEFSTAANTEGVPVVQPPPLEDVAPPTATPTEPPLTATPDLLRPTIYSFTADRYSITPGESVVLSWDLANARVAFLRYNDVEEGVAAPGSKTVSPDKDIKYTLIARNDAGETTAELTIKVAESAPTPVPVLRDGKMRIANDQYIDFDQGFVQSQAGGGTDFHWDGQQQQFFPQGGASGALLSQPYNEIALADCLAVSYTCAYASTCDQPISGVDGSTQIVGCYITNERRYGKFFISEWDLAANLTIQWLTWDYQP